MASSSPVAPNFDAAEEPILLPGESLAKYRDKPLAASSAPVAEPEAPRSSESQETSRPSAGSSSSQPSGAPAGGPRRFTGGFLAGCSPMRAQNPKPRLYPRTKISAWRTTPLFPRTEIILRVTKPRRWNCPLPATVRRRSDRSTERRPDHRSGFGHRGSQAGRNAGRSARRRAVGRRDF